jgi:hypothetical protein
MRALALAAITALFAGCNSTLFFEPKVLVSPYATAYQLRGDIRMQSDPSGGAPPVWNAPQSMRTFGQDRTRDDVGARVDIGDGFAGIRMDYFRLDIDTTRAGTLDGDWGNFQNGDRVSMRATMDELRIGYLEPLWRGEAIFREQPLDLRVAAGGLLAHRNADLVVRQADGPIRQQVDIQGNLVYGAIRGRVGWQSLALEVDLAMCPDLALGGDFSGMQHDLELRLSYAVPRRDMTVFAGFRHSSLAADGSSGRFGYEADVTLEGFQFGMTLSF